MLFAFILSDFWFQPETHRTKNETHPRRPNSEDTIWFVALAKEQPTLVWEQWLHGTFFRVELRMMVGRLLAPLDAIAGRTVVILKPNRVALGFRQCRQNLPHL
jgi:hypothetical protein